MAIEGTASPPEAPRDTDQEDGAASTAEAARRCLMCGRWIEDRRLAAEPDEVLCSDHRRELLRQARR